MEKVFYKAIAIASVLLLLLGNAAYVAELNDADKVRFMLFEVLFIILPFTGIYLSIKQEYE